jgi:hypothetical protein
MWVLRYRFAGEQRRWSKPRATTDIETAFLDARDILRCQFAFNRDPLFASNFDPSWCAGIGLSS